MTTKPSFEIRGLIFGIISHMVLEITPGGGGTPDTASPILLPFNDRPRILTTAEIDTRRESLSRMSDLWTEEHDAPNRARAIVGHWGHRVTREEMDQEIHRIALQLGEEPKLFPNSGFDVLYRMPVGYGEEEIDADTREVGVRLATRILDQKGWRPQDVDFFDYGSSVGKGDTAAELALDLGLVNARTLTARLACNSAGYLLARRLQDEEAVGKNVLLLDVDPITRMLVDPTKSDPISRQLFSNGAAGFAYQPVVDLKYLNGVAIERRDTRGITAIAPYEQEVGGWVGDEDHTIHTDEKGNVRVKMQPTPEGKDFWMNGRTTALFFVRLGTDGIVLVHQQHAANNNGREFDHVTGHQASKPIDELLKQILLTKHGIDTRSSWGVVRDGNSSSATSLIAFSRSMSQYQPGQHVLYASYGAGGTANCFALEIGKGAA